MPSPRQYQVARLALEGLRYAEIADRVNSRAKQSLKRQSIYCSLRSIGTRQAMAEIIAESEVYSKESLKKKVSEIINHTQSSKPTGPQVKVIELGMKSEGMLVDKTEINQRNVTVNIDLTALSLDQLQEQLRLRLKQVSRGPIETQAQVGESGREVGQVT